MCNRKMGRGEVTWGREARPAVAVVFTPRGSALLV